MALRLRQAGERSIITWKGPIEAGPYKIRPELETTVGSVEVAADILTRLGYELIFRYREIPDRIQAAGSAGLNRSRRNADWRFS